MLMLLFVAAAGLTPLLKRILPRIVPDARNSKVFRTANGVWTSGPGVWGGAWEVQVSGRGTVWASGAARGGLSRLDGDRWTRYGRAEFGSRTDWIRGGFALLDEEVWGATGEGVVRFDGRSWRLYRDALKTHRPSAIVAGRAGIWVVDDDGNLSHFEGGHWEIRKLRDVLPGAPSAGHDYLAVPRLALTNGRRLWIFWRGLWWQDGEVWRPVRPPGIDLAKAWLIGQDANGIWLWHWGANEIAAVTPEGKVAARYRLRERGLSEHARISRLVVADGRIWVATGAGLVVFEGGQWRNLGMPPGSTFLTDVAIAPDGSAWVVGETTSLVRLVPRLLACVLPLIVIGPLVGMWLRGRAENALAAREALAGAAGYLPGVSRDQFETDGWSRRISWLPAVFASYPFAVVAIFLAVLVLFKHWPDAPESALTAGVLAAFALPALGIWLWASRGRRFWERAKWLLYIAIIGLAVYWIGLTWVDRLVPIAALRGPVRCIVVVLLATIVIAGRDLLTLFLVKPAMTAGDYDRALRRLRWLGLGRPTAGMIANEGLIHDFSGRPAEAEKCFRRALAGSVSGLRSGRAELLACLGEAVGDQDRYGEAEKCLQKAIEMAGDRSSSSRFTLAVLLLKRGTEPQRSLELIDEAIRIAEAKHVPTLLATRAWALALLGRRQEAEQVIERAFEKRSRTSAALLATQRVHAGMALLAMAQAERAIDHFRAARDADPQGKYGALALQLLKVQGAAGR